MRLLGYVTSRKFSNFVMPVPAQNACLREYASSIKAEYVLPPLEHYFKNCYMQLFTALNNMKNGDILGLYSVSMLPYNKDKLQDIFDIIDKNKGYIYCILEAKKLNNFEDTKKLLYSYKIRDYLDQLNQPSIESIRNLITNYG